MRSTVVIPRDEYQKLRKQAKAYQQLAGRIFESVLTDSVDAVVEDFRKTKLYSEAFLSDLAEGLQKIK